MLDELEGASRQKREVDENGGDEKPSDVKELSREDVNDVKSTLNEIKVPLKNGSPAFSIHAEKVYILYPSLFQDPNIFGKFTMPQTVNMDPMSVKQGEPPRSVPNIHVPQPVPANGRKFKREAAAKPLKAPEDPSRKRNLELKVNGTIVVVNQDVIENNLKEAYWRKQ